MPGTRITQADFWIVPLGEAYVIVVVALLSFWMQQPLIFASLGPTAYEMAAMPRLPSARPYNILVGHLIGVLCGFFALWVTHARYAPQLAPGHPVTWPRIAAVALAATLTALLVIVAHASQPAALATSLLVALGAMQTARAGVDIMIAVFIVWLAGEPVRRARLHRMAVNEARGAPPPEIVP